MAVDESIYPELVGKTLLVYGEDQYVVTPVRDSHRGGNVADFPIRFYESAFGTLDTQHGINAYIVGRKIRQKRRMELWRSW